MTRYNTRSATGRAPKRIQYSPSPSASSDESEDEAMSVESEQPRRPARRRPKADSAARVPKQSPLSNESDLHQVFLHVINAIPDEWDRFQAAASLAVAGCLGTTEWQVYLKDFWEVEAARLSPNGYTKGPFYTLEQLKAAAKEGGLKVNGLTKKAEFAPIVPQLVPPVVVKQGTELLRRAVVARDIQGIDPNDNKLDERINVTRAKSEYQLVDSDFQGLNVLRLPNPHHAHGADMRLYILRDILEVAYRKHGGARGLAAVQQASITRKQKRQDNILANRISRRHQLRDGLLRYGVDQVPELNVGEDPTHGIANSAWRSYIKDGLQSLDFILGRYKRRALLEAAFQRRGIDVDRALEDNSYYIEYGGDGVVQMERVINEQVRKHRRITLLTEAMQAQGIPVEPVLERNAEFINRSPEIHGQLEQVIGLEVSRHQRTERLVAALEANGLQLEPALKRHKNYIETGENDEDALQKVINSETEIKNRPAILTAALAERGITYRPESDICRDFLGGFSNISMNKVIEEMEETDFYEKYTNVDARHLTSSYIKNEALKRFYKEKGREAVLAMADIPSSIRERIRSGLLDTSEERVRILKQQQEEGVQLNIEELQFLVNQQFEKQQRQKQRNQLHQPHQNQVSGMLTGEELEEKLRQGKKLSKNQARRLAEYRQQQQSQLQQQQQQQNQAVVVVEHEEAQEMELQQPQEQQQQQQEDGDGEQQEEL